MSASTEWVVFFILLGCVGLILSIFVIDWFRGFSLWFASEDHDSNWCPIETFPTMTVSEGDIPIGSGAEQTILMKSASFSEFPAETSKIMRQVSSFLYQGVENLNTSLGTMTEDKSDLASNTFKTDAVHRAKRMIGPISSQLRTSLEHRPNNSTNIAIANEVGEQGIRWTALGYLDRCSTTEHSTVPIVSSLPLGIVHSSTLPVPVSEYEAVDDANNACCVCLDTAADAVLIECGHGGLCSGERRRNPVTMFPFHASCGLAGSFHSVTAALSRVHGPQAM